MSWTKKLHNTLRDVLCSLKQNAYYQHIAGLHFGNYFQIAGFEYIVIKSVLNQNCSTKVVDFYEFYEGLQEGWDGPALLVFSDGIRLGARLDRNGLRPARYWETADGYAYMASEVMGGTISDAGDVVVKGRLGPGVYATHTAKCTSNFFLQYLKLAATGNSLGSTSPQPDNHICCLWTSVI